MERGSPVSSSIVRHIPTGDCAKASEEKIRRATRASAPRFSSVVIGQSGVDAVADTSRHTSMEPQPEMEDGVITGGTPLRLRFALHICKSCSVYSPPVAAPHP